MSTSNIWILCYVLRLQMDTLPIKDAPIIVRHGVATSPKRPVTHVRRVAVTAIRPPSDVTDHVFSVTTNDDHEAPVPNEIETKRHQRRHLCRATKVRKVPYPKPSAHRNRNSSPSNHDSTISRTVFRVAANERVVDCWHIKHVWEC
jgi:hypothetical protein